MISENYKARLPFSAAIRPTIRPFFDLGNNPAYFPVVLYIVFAGALAFPATRQATLWILDENHPVEVLTFMLLIWGGIFGLAFAASLVRQRARIGYILFYTVFSIGLLFTGMEEIAWGQQFWGFATPESLNSINMQSETTIHNIRGFHGNTEVFRLIFGVGGLIGILLRKRSKLLKIAPPLILFGWFVIITAHSAVDVFDDIVAVPKFMEAATSQLAELIELFIAFAGCIYLYVKSSIVETESNAG